jgi:MFS family permease
VAVPAIISLQFPNNNEVYQGYAVMALGIGLTIGPVFGSIVFSIFNYSTSMFAFAVIVFSVGIYGVILIPQ